MTDGIHAVVLIQLNGMSSNACWLLKFHEYIQLLGPIAPTIGTVKSCRINTARSSNWRATGPSRSEAMLPVAQFVRADWVSMRSSELYPCSALIPEAFDFGAGVPSPTR